MHMTAYIFDDDSAHLGEGENVECLAKKAREALPDRRRLCEYLVGKRIRSPTVQSADW
jgi:hypothetical protein